MILFLFLFGLALGAASPPEDIEVKLQRGNCPMFWFSFNGRCYKYISTRTSWADAKIYCVSHGVNLVSIHSRDEQEFVTALIKNFDPSQGFTWIGLGDIHKEGTWMWSDGYEVDFTLWGTKEPNNTNGLEHCGHTNFELEQWNDDKCSETFPSVCATRFDCSQQLRSLPLSDSASLALGAQSHPDEHELKLQCDNCLKFWFSLYGRCYNCITTM
ncbi:lactose-binding lectin l-2-like [Brachyistius frenatus]|uniref:lactose-binding lectin l-2-like n=1 Tax=Brachyistius frenatus TaxID=100188 RepID=UPI0037E7D4BA